MWIQISTLLRVTTETAGIGSVCESVCETLWQNMVLMTPTVVRTTTEAVLSILGGIYVCLSVDGFWQDDRN